MSSLIKKDSVYNNWIEDVSRRFRQSQLKATIKVNSEMLRFSWSLGRDIADMSKQYGYGSAFYRMISGDLQNIFPNIKSFSTTNLKYMRHFYEMYPEVGNRQQLVDDLGQDENRQQPVDDLKEIFQIPWGHHIQIMGKCKGNPGKGGSCVP